MAEHRYSVLTRVGPGTPMGELMRQYWVPAIMSSELVADGDPVRVMLLGEKLVAFRTTSGQVGVMDERCPHRVASLFYGRNEEDGIRCVYHGWKFAADGTCVDQGNVPVEQQFCSRTPAKAYPTIEKAGIVWAYMGHAKTLPKLPAMPILETDEPVSVRCVLTECSWLQRLEGDIDTSHAGFLHSENRDKIAAMDVTNNPQLLGYKSLQPEFKVADTAYGTMYGALRPAPDGVHDYWRIGHFLFPFFSMTAAPPLGSMTVGASVPMDDEHVMRFSITTQASRQQMVNDTISKTLGVERNFAQQPNTTDWYGRWRMAATKDNDYQIDREKQRHGGSYTGVRGIGPQDQMITESMGAITDHAFENMAPSDLMIVKTRNRLLEILDDVASGKPAPGVENPEIYAPATGGYANLPKGKDWLDAYADYTKRDVRQAVE